MSYIEREAAKKAVCEGCNAEYGEEPCEPSDCAVMQALRSIPAADVRPVVTCGECKHWFENGTDYCSCDRDALLRERDFFCAAGEKREES